MTDSQPSPAAEAKSPRLRDVPAVTRSIAILRLLGRQTEPMGVHAIANALSLVPSTCLHILRVLVHEGLVAVDPSTKRYRLGIGMLTLARSVLEHNSFRSAVQPALDRLSADWKVTAIGVEVSEPEHIVVVALARSPLPFSLHMDVGSRFPSLISATGRLLAAFNPRPWPEVEARFQQLRWRSPIDFAAWREEVELARRQGYSVDNSNYISGVTIVAVPLFDAQQRVTHTLVCAGVGHQLETQQIEALVRDMKREATQVAEQLFMGS